MKCPKCKKEIEGVPAISRYDNNHYSSIRIMIAELVRHWK